MSGLIQKDLCLLFQRKQTIFLFLGISLIMGASTDGAFVIGYLTMLCAIFTVSTISYDEFDNGYSFLMTLPITRNIYVLSKYMFCLAGGFFGWLVSAIITLGFQAARENGVQLTDLYEAALFIPIFFIIIALMLPVQLKYGAERSRLVLALIGGTVFVIFYIGKKILPEGLPIPSFLSNLSDTTVYAVVWIVGILALVVSYGISKKFMDHKEF